MSEEPVLSSEEVAGVLSGNPGEETAAAPAAQTDGPLPYSLREPVAIAANAEAGARDRMKQIVEALSGELKSGAGVEAPIKIALEGFQQQRALNALSTLPNPVWVASLGSAQGGGLSLALQPAVALALIDKVLGGSGAVPQEGREPTKLEARVLSRLIGAAAGQIGKILDVELTALELKVDAVPAHVAAAAETVGVGPLRFTLGESDHASLLLVSASLLLPQTTKPSATKTKLGPIAAGLERVPFAVRPVLPAGHVSMAELIGLEPGKVLRFDVPESQQLRLTVDGIEIARGRIERSDGKSSFAVERTVSQRTRKESS